MDECAAVPGLQRAIFPPSVLGIVPSKVTTLVKHSAFTLVLGISNIHLVVGSKSVLDDVWATQSQSLCGNHVLPCTETLDSVYIHAFVAVLCCMTEGQGGCMPMDNCLCTAALQHASPFAI